MEITQLEIQMVTQPGIRRGVMELVALMVRAATALVEVAVVAVLVVQVQIVLQMEAMALV